MTRLRQERIFRPSASSMTPAIIDGAPFLAGAPVAAITSPAFTVVRTHP
jgi:hypothetical protein